MSESETIRDRYRAVCERVGRAAVRSGRLSEDVLVIAVTKFAAQDDIRALMDLGHLDFGENKVQQLLQRGAMAQEYLERHKVLPETRTSRKLDLNGDLDGEIEGGPESIRWHMIGHLQRNKAKSCVAMTRLIHSVDSLRLIEELQNIGIKKDRIIDVLVQVNVSEESSKAGVPLAAARAICEQIDSMIHVRVRGLMTMAPLSENPEDSRLTFSRLHDIFQEIRKTGLSEGRFNLLSMGMSGDYEVGIEEGANLVRIGTAIFGKRSDEGDVEEQEEEQTKIVDQTVS